MTLLKRLFGFSAIAFYLLAPGAITFAAAPAPTCQLTLNTSTIQVGGSVTLRWTSTNATGGAITNVGNVSPSGSINLLPTSASYTTYIGSFTGPGGTANCSATVAVTTGGGSTGGSTSGDTTYGTQDAQLGTGTFTPPNTTNTPAATVNSTPASALVTCGFNVFDSTKPTDHTTSTGCEACDLATLVQNIINFLIGLSIPIAAALFAYAGVLYFTSAGDHHKLDQAKQIFKDALIGFVIVITAWLVINTVLHVIFSQGEFANGSWFSIQCSSGFQSRPVTDDIGQVLGKVLGNGVVTSSNSNITSTGSSFGTVCPDGSAPSVTENGNICVGSNGNVTAAATGNSLYSCPSGYSLTNSDGNVSCDKVDSQGNLDSKDASCTSGASTNDNGQCTDQSGKVVLPTTVQPGDIAAAAEAYRHTDTSAGPDGGNLACAWSVNNILKSAGIDPIDGNSVYSMEQDLKNGRGSAEDQTGAQAGDIVMLGGMSHVGICQNAGCTLVLSNSSSKASFDSVYPPTSGSRYYRVNK